jgi:hypothetical protein
MHKPVGVGQSSRCRGDSIEQSPGDIGTGMRHADQQARITALNAKGIH